MDPLETVRHHAGLDQIHDAVGEHLGVDAEVVLAEQAPQRRIGNRADAHLQRGAIGHQRRDVSADGVLHRRRRRRREDGERPVRARERVDAREGHQRVAVRARHLRVDFGDHKARGAGGGERRVDGGAQRAVPVRIGGRELQQRDVERTRPEVKARGCRRGRSARSRRGRPRWPRGPAPPRTVRWKRSALRVPAPRTEPGPVVCKWYSVTSARSVLRESASTSGVGVAAAPCTNTRIPLVTHETAASALVACVFQSIMESLEQTGVGACEPRVAASPSHQDRQLCSMSM